MELSDFTFRIILIFIPGFISFIIIDNLTNHKEYKLYKILLYSLLLGFLCYYVYYIITLIPGINFEFSFHNYLTDNKTPLNFKEILLASSLSIIIGFITSLLINRKFIFFIAHKLKISKKFGDVDLWSYVMNSNIQPWVVIRDIEHDLMYEGYIKVFSDSTDINEGYEVFLSDVKVYKNSTADELYEIPGIYLNVNRNYCTVEFPLL